MELQDIPYYRMMNQKIISSSFSKPEEAVSYMGALQAQDYGSSLWAVGLRLKNAKKRDVEAAIDEKLIVRTWPMRNTLHFVSPEDVRWMLSLYRERTIPNYQKKNGLTEEILAQGRKIVVDSFKGRKKVSSKDIYANMQATGNPILKIKEVQMHILRRTGRDGIVCYASHDGKTPMFALLDEWVRKHEPLSREKALEELALRYFTSHGPATLADFVWWAGLGVGEAKLGLEKASSRLRREEIEGKAYYMARKMSNVTVDESVYLLPAFDEYLISYKDRSAMLSSKKTQEMLTSGKIFFTNSNGIFLPVIVAGGQIVGTWKRVIGKTGIEITILEFSKLSKEQLKGVKEAADRYGEFMGMPVTLR